MGVWAGPWAPSENGGHSDWASSQTLSGERGERPEAQAVLAKAVAVTHISPSHSVRVTHGRMLGHLCVLDKVPVSSGLRLRARHSAGLRQIFLLLALGLLTEVGCSGTRAETRTQSHVGEAVQKRQRGLRHPEPAGHWEAAVVSPWPTSDFKHEHQQSPAPPPLLPVPERSLLPLRGPGQPMGQHTQGPAQEKWALGAVWPFVGCLASLCFNRPLAGVQSPQPDAWLDPGSVTW